MMKAKAWCYRKPALPVGSSLIMQRPGRVTAGEDAEGLGFEAMDYGDDGKAF